MSVETDLDEISIQLEQAQNLLNVFIEFCSGEGIMQQKDVKQSLFCFLERLPMFMSLLDCANDDICDGRNRLNIIADNLCKTANVKKDAAATDVA